MLNKVIIAIDPGKLCGYATGVLHGDRTLVYQSGTWQLEVNARMESKGMIYLRLEQNLRALMVAGKPALIVFEEVRAHEGTLAAQMYGALVGVIMRVAVELDIEYISVPVAHIKRQATGKGAARKVIMEKTARRAFRIPVVDDNQADALWLLDYALREVLR